MCTVNWVVEGILDYDKSLEKLRKEFPKLITAYNKCNSKENKKLLIEEFRTFLIDNKYDRNFMLFYNIEWYNILEVIKKPKLNRRKIKYKLLIFINENYKNRMHMKYFPIKFLNKMREIYCGSGNYLSSSSLYEFYHQNNIMKSICWTYKDFINVENSIKSIFLTETT